MVVGVGVQWGIQLREIFSFATAEDCVCYMVFMNDWSGQ